tara:strand:+ start:13590 stop:14222 length:633 start_codon:yes stop_codon:yes gene_type:complete
MITLKNVTKKYNNYDLISYNDLIINKGDFISIVGPSGSGKSTLIDLIAKLNTCSSGVIKIFDKSINTYDDKRSIQLFRKEIGIMSSTSSLFSMLNISDNILLPLIIHNEDICNSIFEYIVEKLNIKNLLDKSSGDLSSGERQRVLLARAMVLKPKILIADEPTANLDLDNTKQLVNFLRYLNDDLKTTIIVATHDDIVSKSSKRIYELEK